MTEESNALAPPISAAQIQAVITQFLADRLQPKLDKVSEEDHEKRALLRADYAPKSWIADAARRVSQIQQVTHALKYLHPDARGTSLYSTGTPHAASAEVGTHVLGAGLLPDVVGNAAALDVYKFLNLSVGAHRILDLALAADPVLAEAFSDNTEEAHAWMAAFATLPEAKNTPASHTLAKQVYWPLGAGHYHLLAPLFPTSLVQRVWQTIRDDRFSDAAKAARAARKANLPHPHGFHEYPHLVIQQFGGTKPQNISQLNSERHGENYLLPSLPPCWNAPRLRPPLATHSVFDRAFGRRPRVRELVRILRDFLARVTQVNNVNIRHKRAELVGFICDEVLSYAAELRDAVETGVLAAGWTLDATCTLNRAEQLWLDPLRHQHDPDFARDYARDDWPDDICRRFGSWLATHLTTKDTPMSTVEAEHWHGVLSQEMRLLRREMADYA